MNLSVLELFVEVMRQGSFAAVARDRNQDPSSVSRAIANLEQELGSRLFQRTTRKLSPTEAGTAYFERIEPLIEDLRAATAQVTDLTEQPRGQLRVTASVSFGLHCMVPLLPRFTAQYPELTVELLLTDTVIDLVAERVDLAVRLGRLEDSTLMAQHLMQTQYRVCAGPAYIQQSGPILGPRDVAQHNCLRFPLAGFQTRWLFKDQAGHITEVPVQGDTVISNAIALKDCAIANMGLALLPNWLIDAELRTGRLIDVLPTYQVTATDFRTAAWLVYPSRAYLPSKVRTLIAFLKEQMSV